MSVPKQMKALVEGPDATKDVPELGANDVLIKVHAVSQNPTDWKHAADMSPEGAVIGCDLAGTVVALGADLKVALAVGDKVAGWVHGGLYAEKGAFAEYAKAQSDLVFKIPEGLKFEEAATFGVPWVTAGQALIESQKKPFPPAAEGEWILIYAGSTGVGLFAIQLAKLMGYKVATTCSPHNHALVKSYGADVVVDYRASDAAEQLRQATGGGVKRGLDCIGEGDSLAIASAAFAPGGGQLNCILPPPQEPPRADVRPVMTLAYTLFGLDFDFGPRGKPKTHFAANGDDRAFHAELYKRTPGYIAQHGLRAPPVEVRGGLEAIEAGFEDMKNGKVSGKRLVYTF